MNSNRIQYTVIALLSFALLFMVLRDIGNNQALTSAEIDDTPIAFRSLETPVEVVVLRRQNLNQSITSSGTAKPSRMTEMTAQVSGQITLLNKKEGDWADQDSVILQISDKAYRLNYQKAEDLVNKRLAEYGVMILGESSGMNDSDSSQFQFDEFNVDPENPNDVESLKILKGQFRKDMLASKVGLTAARLDLEKAAMDLNNTVIRAPFQGYIADLDLTPDGDVKTGAVLFRLVDMNVLFIETGILETEIPMIKPGSRAELSFPAYPGRNFQGRVSTINPVLDPESGTCRVMIRMPNPELLIKPGMYANIVLETRSFEDRLLIPRDALLIRDERKVTFVYESGRAKWHYVKTGLENDDSIEILEGLSEGDSLITSGHFNLAHDALVEIVEKE